MPRQETIANILKKATENEADLFADNTPQILQIHRIHDYLHQELFKIISKYNLQEADFSVLGTLRREKAPYCLSPTELSHSMLFSSGGLTKVLNRVMDAGLIDRIENPEDKRSKLVKLTEKGKVLIEKIIPELHGQEKTKMAILSADEQQQLGLLLKKLLSAWE